MQRLGPRSETGLLQIYLDKISSMRKQGAFVMYQVHVVMLNLGAEFRRNFICNGHTLVGHSSAEYEEGYRKVQIIDERECIENGTICETFELVP